MFRWIVLTENIDRSIEPISAILNSVYLALQQGGYFEGYRVLEGNLLVTIDGVLMG
jgi:hypothetical protein